MSRLTGSEVRSMMEAYAAIYSSKQEEVIEEIEQLDEAPAPQTDIGARLGRGLVGSLKDLPAATMAQFQGKGASASNDAALARQANRGAALQQLITKGQLPGSTSSSSTTAKTQPTQSQQSSTQKTQPAGSQQSSAPFKWDPNKNILASKGGKLGIMDKGDPKSWREPSFQEKGEIPISNIEKFKTSAAGQQFIKQRDAAKTSATTPAKPAIPTGTTAGGTTFQRRAATGEELRAAQAARAAAKASGNAAGAEEAAVRAGVAASKPASSTLSQTVAAASKPSAFSPASSSSAPTSSTLGQTVAAASKPSAFKPATSTQAISAAPSTSPSASGSVVPATNTIAAKPSTAMSQDAIRKQKLNMSMEYDVFDVVLEYLFSQGHVDTLEEALYVMMEMDGDCIQSIVEGGFPRLPDGSPIKGDLGGPNPIDPVTGKSKYKMLKSGEVENPNFGKIPVKGV